MKMFRLLAWLVALIVAILCSAWAFGAIYYDFPAVRQMAAGRPCPPVVVHAEAGQ